MTRKQLSFVLALNALTKPVNVIAPAVVLVAALVLGALWLAPVAAICWLALVGVTFFDEREAGVAGERARADRHVEPPRPRPGAFAPEIGKRVRAAHGARAAIRLAVEQSEPPL